MDVAKNRDNTPPPILPIAEADTTARADGAKRKSSTSVPVNTPALGGGKERSVSPVNTTGPFPTRVEAEAARTEETSRGGLRRLFQRNKPIAGRVSTSPPQSPSTGKTGFLGRKSPDNNRGGNALPLSPDVQKCLAAHASYYFGARVVESELVDPATRELLTPIAEQCSIEIKGAATKRIHNVDVTDFLTTTEPLVDTLWSSEATPIGSHRLSADEQTPKKLLQRYTQTLQQKRGLTLSPKEVETVNSLKRLLRDGERQVNEARLALKAKALQLSKKQEAGMPSRKEIEIIKKQLESQERDGEVQVESARSQLKNYELDPSIIQKINDRNINSPLSESELLDFSTWVTNVNAREIRAMISDLVDPSDFLKLVDNLDPQDPQEIDLGIRALFPRLSNDLSTVLHRMIIAYQADAVIKTTKELYAGLTADFPDKPVQHVFVKSLGEDRNKKLGEYQSQLDLFQRRLNEKLISKEDAERLVNNTKREAAVLVFDHQSKLVVFAMLRSCAARTLLFKLKGNEDNEGIKKSDLRQIFAEAEFSLDKMFCKTVAHRDPETDTTISRIVFDPSKLVVNDPNYIAISNFTLQDSELPSPSPDSGAVTPQSSESTPSDETTP